MVELESERGERGGEGRPNGKEREGEAGVRPEEQRDGRVSECQFSTNPTSKGPRARRRKGGGDVRPLVRLPHSSQNRVARPVKRLCFVHQPGDGEDRFGLRWEGGFLRVGLFDLTVVRGGSRTNDDEPMDEREQSHQDCRRPFVAAEPPIGAEDDCCPEEEDELAQAERECGGQAKVEAGQVGLAPLLAVCVEDELLPLAVDVVWFVRVGAVGGRWAESSLGQRSFEEGGRDEHVARPFEQGLLADHRRRVR